MDFIYSQNCYRAEKKNWRLIFIFLPHKSFWLNSICMRDRKQCPQTNLCHSFFFFNNNKDKLFLSVAYLCQTFESMQLCQAFYNIFPRQILKKKLFANNIKNVLAIWLENSILQRTWNFAGLPLYQEYTALWSILTHQQISHVSNNFKSHKNCSFLVSYAYRLAAFQGKHSRNNRSVTWQALKQRRKNAVVLQKIYKCFIPTRSSSNSLFAYVPFLDMKSCSQSVMFWWRWNTQSYIAEKSHIAKLLSHH